MTVQATLETLLSELPVPVRVHWDAGVAGPSNPAITLRLRGRAPLVALAARAIGDFASCYVEGQVDIEGSMRDLMRAAGALVGSRPRDAKPSLAKRFVLALASMVKHTLARDRQQIEFHYDVSDAFYALWLDPLRVYSCAYFADPEATLAQAQEAKLDLICRKLALEPGMRLLDIGCGWGGLLFHAAERYGVEAVGITLSRNQHAYVQREIERRGLAGRVEVRCEDYREYQAARPFDRLASVGMFEHVGRANMTRYCRRLHDLLVPGGRVMNHGITTASPDNRGLGGGISEFIERYIFPGGELLHASAILEHMARGGLEVVDVENLRPHYARTLWHWSDNLERQLDAARAALTETHPAERAEKILRAYRLYLAGSALGFEQGWIAIHQFLAIRPDGNAQRGVLPGAQSDYPFRRDFIYGSGSLESLTSLGSSRRSDPPALASGSDRA